MAKVKVYCYGCKKVHQFTPDEVERILYAGLGAWSDSANGIEEKTGFNLKDVCWNEVLSWSRDIECYEEFTEESLEARRKAIKEADRCLESQI